MTLIFIILFLFAYFLPTIVAGLRKTHNFGGILFLNFLFGWSVVGWFVALVMSCGSHSK
jgi:hypothetical protein